MENFTSLSSNFIKQRTRSMEHLAAMKVPFKMSVAVADKAVVVRKSTFRFGLVDKRPIVNSAGSTYYGTGYEFTSVQ